MSKKSEVKNGSFVQFLNDCCILVSRDQKHSFYREISAAYFLWCDTHSVTSRLCPAMLRAKMEEYPYLRLNETGWKYADRLLHLSRIKVFGHHYQHIQDDQLTMAAGTPGQICSRLHWIKTDPTAPRTRQEEALLHEIFEALRYHLNLEEVISHQVMSSLSEGLFAVMKDNPAYFTIRIPPLPAPTELGGSDIPF